MELFTSQWEYIRKVGVVEWLKRYPINPVTIVAAVLIIGIAVLVLSVKKRKRLAEKARPAHAALVILKPRNGFNRVLADNVRVMSVDGQPATWFFYKTVPAIYLAPGEHRLTLYAEWAGRGRLASLQKSVPETFALAVAAEGIYALHYHLDQGRYLFTEGDLYEDEAWMAAIGEEDFL